MSTRWGRPQTGSSIQDGRLSDAHRAGPSSPSGPTRFQASRCVPGSPARLLLPLGRRAHRRPGTSRFVQSGGSQPAPPPPTEAQPSHNPGRRRAVRGGLARGFPKRWRRDHEASARGPSSTTRGKGGVSGAGDDTAERVSGRTARFKLTN